MSPAAIGALVHTACEALAYGVGTRYFFALRRRHGHAAAEHPEGAWVLVGAVLGAAAGSKLLDLAQFSSYVAAHTNDLGVVFGGKTIVGGLLGGWIGVELAKKAIGLRRSTGDLLVAPILLGLAIGRMGCLLAGPGDHTEGAITDVPWAIDFGDGPRHPTPLYEIVFLGAFAVARRWLPVRREGDGFAWFMAAYLVFRFVVDFWKAPFGPDPLPPAPDVVFWITPIQVACLLGASVAAWKVSRGARARIGETEATGP